jgi:hypothetical protein
MKANYFTLLLSLLFLACGSDAEKTNRRITTAIENAKQESAENENKEVKKSLNKKDRLTKEQLLELFPEKIGPHNKFNVYVAPGESVATGTYGDLKKPFTFSVSDGAGRSSIVENFDLTYQSDLKGPEGTEYIKKERGNFKTLAFDQPGLHISNIAFIYNQRFRITLEGPENPDKLWEYIDFTNLKKLDKYQ